MQRTLAFSWLTGKPSLSPPALRRESAGGVLDHLAKRKQRLLVEWTADQLQAERQALAVEAGRHRNPRQPGHVHRHGENVIEIHLDRIGLSLLADPERRRRRRRRQHRVDALREAVLEILFDER